MKHLIAALLISCAFSTAAYAMANSEHPVARSLIWGFTAPDAGLTENFSPDSEVCVEGGIALDAVTSGQITTLNADGTGGPATACTIEYAPPAANAKEQNQYIAATFSYSVQNAEYIQDASSMVSVDNIKFKIELYNDALAGIVHDLAPTMAMAMYGLGGGAEIETVDLSFNDDASNPTLTFYHPNGLVAVCALAFTYEGLSLSEPNGTLSVTSDPLNPLGLTVSTDGYGATDFTLGSETPVESCLDDCETTVDCPPCPEGSGVSCLGGVCDCMEQTPVYGKKGKKGKRTKPIAKVPASECQTIADCSCPEGQGVGCIMGACQCYEPHVVVGEISA
jgi:hypothetical protein